MTAEQIYQRDLSGARRNPASARIWCEQANKSVKPAITGIRRYFERDGRPCVEMMPVEFIKTMGQK